MFKTSKIGKKLLLGSTVIVLIFLVINVVSFVSLESFAKQSALESHTFEVLDHIEHILAVLLDAETGQRGYVLTGQARYLEPYDRGIMLVNLQVDDVQKLTSDNPRQQRRIVELRLLIADKIEELQETIELRSQDKLDEAVAVVLSDRGKDIMDNIRNLLDEMKNEENALLEVRKEEASKSHTITELIIIFGSLIGFVVAIIISLVFTNSIVGSVIKAKNTAIEIAKGNMDVSVDTSGSDEMADLSRAIDKMRQNLKKSFGDIKSRAKQLNIQLQKTDDAKEKISREKEKIDAILHSIGDGVFVVDINLKITMYNQIAAEISGYSTKEAIGKYYNKVLKFRYEKDGKVNDKFIKDAMATGEIQEMSNHTMLINKNGEKISVADSAAPLKGKDGKVVGCVVVFRDVTKEREVDRMKTEFVSVASHQLRTPLSAIKWFLEMVLEGDAGKINKEQRDFLQQAFDSNTRMISLVNDLLNVSRLETGRINIEPVPTDLTKLCQTVINESKPLISDRDLKFKFTKPAKIDKINIDPKLISQVVANLLSNGIKYTTSGGKVELKISIEKPNIKISVIDSGMGIPKAQQQKLFQKFFRADNAVSKETEGTGLGLYVAKSVVVASGGNIGFISEEDKGSTFWFTLPLLGSKKVKGEKGLEKSKI